MSQSSFIPSEKDFTLMADKFSALGEPMRLRILSVLMQGEQNVGAIVQAVRGSQANISRHLQKLSHSGIVASRKEGQSSIYYIIDPRIVQLCSIVCGHPGSPPPQ